MSRLFKFDVEQEHIDQGFPGISRRCPMVFALKKDGIENPMVGNSILFYGPNHNRKSAYLSKSMMQFKNFFDCAGPKGVVPCTLEILLDD